MKAVYTLALFPLLASAAPDHSPYGPPAPKLYCRDTNTSIYAEVCVPAFADETKPVELAVKRVVPDQYCYTQVQTQCEEVTTSNPREICTYNYISRKTQEPATTTKVTYETNSETMKVTTCRPSGYGSPHQYGYGADKGEHQYCREEYQTQQYDVPKVTTPLEITVEMAVPEPVKECVTKTIEYTETVCRDIEVEKCIDLVKFEDGIETVDQTETVLGEPNCNKVTLTLPTEACQEQKHGYGYHG